MLLSSDDGNCSKINWTNDTRHVCNPDYSILTAKNFFGGSDPIRIVIIVYIILSLIFNTINYVVIIINMKRHKLKLALATWLMLGILLMNFIHTATYFFEWVIKEEGHTIYVKVRGEDVKVGALLTGNPNNIVGCDLQGFLLIFSSISQDFLINIFFYLVNSTEFNEFYVKLAIIFLGLLFPFLFTFLLHLVKGLGLNDEFCYVKKFNITYYENGNIDYEYFKPFQLLVIIVYLIRILNFVATYIFLHKIFNYVRSRKEPVRYIIKAIFIPIIQLFTIGIGVIYRFINLGFPEISASLSGTYLILNTSDGVFFPIGFAIQNNIFGQLKVLIGGDKIICGKNNKKHIEFIEKHSEPEEEIDIA